MAYQRFLTDNDYLALITKPQLDSMIQGVTERFAQAEQRAEMKIVDYLDQFYEVGAALDCGKRIKDYSELVTYPSNAYFKKDGAIFRTTKALNARHEPTSVVYWTEMEGLVLPAEQLRDEKSRILPYLQQRTYKPGDIVTYLGATWKCIVENGWDFKNIQIPGIEYWKEVGNEGWLANHHYKIGDVVSFEGSFYAVIEDDEFNDKGEEQEENAVNWSNAPDINSAFGLIGKYDKGYNYSVGCNDYVVWDDRVYDPVLSPNADEPKENVNMVPDDPRNFNLVNYMASMSLYYLNALIAPTNISQTRIDMFEEAMNWIENAAKMRLDPHIKRRMDRDTCTPKDDWAMASFETDAATQINSPWFV